MKIKSMKLAQAIPGTDSLILANNPLGARGTGYEITLTDRGYFSVVPKSGKHEGEEVLVFPANVAYALPLKEEKKTRKSES